MQWIAPVVVFLFKLSRSISSTMYLNPVAEIKNFWINSFRSCCCGAFFLMIMFSMECREYSAIFHHLRKYVTAARGHAKKKHGKLRWSHPMQLPMTKLESETVYLQNMPIFLFRLSKFVVTVVGKHSLVSKNLFKSHIWSRDQRDQILASSWKGGPRCFLWCWALRRTTCHLTTTGSHPVLSWVWVLAAGGEYTPGEAWLSKPSLARNPAAIFFVNSGACSTVRTARWFRRFEWSYLTYSDRFYFVRG